MLTPALSIGAIITIPSGMFCKAIPPAIINAWFTSPEPKPTPAAMPSGRLCIAIAITKSSTRFRLVLLCSSISGPIILCKCGTSLSIRFRHNAPAKIPPIVNNSLYFPPNSKEGTISPITAAASITPAAKARTISENLCDRFLNKKPIPAPMNVAPPTPRAVKRTISILHLLFFLLGCI